MSDNDTFRKWIRAARIEAGLSQQQVARALETEGIHLYQTTINKIEQGDRVIRLDEAAALTRVFGTTLDVALGLKPGDPNSLAARQLTSRTALLQQIRTQLDAELGRDLPEVDRA